MGALWVLMVPSADLSNHLLAPRELFKDPESEPLIASDLRSLARDGSLGTDLVFDFQTQTCGAERYRPVNLS